MKNYLLSTLTNLSNVIEEITDKNTYCKSEMDTSQFIQGEIVVILGLVGGIKGSIIVSLSVDAAKKITTVFTDKVHEKVDKWVMSSVGEFGNMISGRIVSAINSNEFIDISPPSVLIGDIIKIMIQDKINESVRIEIEEIGAINVNLLYKLN